MYVETDGVGYRRASVSINSAENGYIDQYADLNLTYKKYVGEAFLSPFITYPDTNKSYPIHDIDFIFLVDHTTPKNLHLVEEHSGATSKAKLFMIIIRRKEIKLASDGSKIT